MGRRARPAAAIVLAALAAALLLAAPASSVAADVAVAPESLARTAAAARAAAIMVLAPDDDAGPFEREDDAGGPAERVLGGGVIVDPGGLAITSARLLMRVDAPKVVSADGAPLDATVVALDPRTDVAVLRLAGDGRPYPFLPFGDSDAVQLGDRVITTAAPHGLVATVRAGIIVATPAPASENPLRNFLQTDAIAGSGSAGAPVVSMRGEIVGLATRLSGDDVGYALPSRIVRAIFLELLERGRVSRPWLGVTTQSLTAELAHALGAPGDPGVLITDALPRGPAARAGVRSGDIVLKVDATPVASRAQLERAVSALRRGRVVTLTLRRERRLLRTSVALAEEPSEWELPPPVARARRLLGIEARPITPAMGVEAAAVEPESPAGVIGIAPGDVIREMDRRPIRDFADFQAAARALRAGAPALLLIQRGSAALYVLIPPRRE